MSFKLYMMIRPEFIMNTLLVSLLFSVVPGFMFYIYLLGMIKVRDTVPGKGKRVFSYMAAIWLFTFVTGFLGSGHMANSSRCLFS